ncbi:MAG: hypothetical protein Q9160_002828 [Pyrenula sp. 1 TL-2023]
MEKGQTYAGSSWISCEKYTDLFTEMGDGWWMHALERLIVLPCIDMQEFLDEFGPRKCRTEIPCPEYANRNLYYEQSSTLDNVSTSNVDDETLRYEFFSLGFTDLIRALNGEDRPQGDDAKYIQAAIVAESCKPISDRFDDIKIYRTLAHDIPSFNRDLVRELARGFRQKTADRANEKD